jgi:hypothetical protein
MVEVVITSPVPNEGDICVEVLNKEGEAVKTVLVEEGRYAKFYVSDTQSINITKNAMVSKRN